MADQLAAAFALGDHKAKIEKYRSILDGMIKKTSIEDLKLFIDHSEWYYYAYILMETYQMHY